MTIYDLQKNSQRIAQEHGFWALYDMTANGDENSMKDIIIDSKLMLIVGEVAEAEDALRHKKPIEEFAEELADVMIRVADLAMKLNIDLTEAIQKKQTYNETRPYKHGKAF
jgi:NTP pyrophosphatase (non-canonical NTP hydrolase)